MIRDIRYTIRFNKEEKENLKTRMYEVNMKQISKYIRFIALNGYIVKKDTTSFDNMIKSFDKIEYELNAIGNNINQIAKKLNCDDEVLVEEFLEVKRELQILRQSNADLFSQACKNYNKTNSKMVIN